VIPATGLIPDVTDGALIESAWGNAIRDRATQRFDTLAALQAGWPGAANGARAVTLDTFRFYTKRAAGGTGWQPDMDFGSPTMTPDAQGRVTVTHALGRASVFAMAVMSSPGFVITEAITTTTVQFRLFNNAGAVITVSTFFRWAAW
jgi:hypothetical protein